MKITKSGRKDKIDHDEEYILSLIEQHDLECPILGRIWEAFYDGPKIYPDLARSIVTELDLINAFLESHQEHNKAPKQWSLSYLRLRDFFSDASNNNSIIACISD